MAPRVLLREDVRVYLTVSCYQTHGYLQKARYFPNIVGSRLDSGLKDHTTHMCAGKVSVIAMLSTRMSEVSYLALLCVCQNNDVPCI